MDHRYTIDNSRLVCCKYPYEGLCKEIDWRSQGSNINGINNQAGMYALNRPVLPAGAVIDTLTGLGNGFDLSAAGEKPLLIGGGVGTPPLYYLAKKLKERGADVRAALGFNRAEEVFYADKFAALGVETYVATADGRTEVARVVKF